MYMDAAIPYLAGVALIILLVGLVLKRLRQPHVVGYILAGVLIGPFGLAVLTDQPTLARIGSFGVLLLMFFIGMELPLKSLVQRWQVPVLGTACQVLVSVLCVWPVGAWLGWPGRRVVFLGFVISMSSTAVLLKVLRESGEVDKPIGRDVVGVTLAQDLAVVPMLIVLGLLAGTRPPAHEVAMQVVGGAGALAILVWVVNAGALNLAWADAIKKDHEMQVFAALFACFGFAFATGVLRVSSALGAFVAGVLIAATRQTDWVRDSLDPFRVVFVGLFFLSVGMLIDLNFLAENWITISMLVAAAFTTNTLINAIILRALGHGWRASLYGGALLAQIGEFSFVLAAVGLQSGIISQYGYQTSIAVISLTLLLSPPWIAVFRRLTGMGRGAGVTT